MDGLYSASPGEIADSIRAMIEGWERTRIHIDAFEDDGRALQSCVDTVISLSLLRPGGEEIKQAYLNLVEVIWDRRRLRRVNWPRHYREVFRLATGRSFFQAMVSTVAGDVEVPGEVGYGTCIDPEAGVLWLPRYAAYFWALDSQISGTGRVVVHEDDSDGKAQHGSLAGMWVAWLTWLGGGEPPVEGWVSSPWYWAAVPAYGIPLNPRTQPIERAAFLRPFTSAAAPAMLRPDGLPKSPTFWWSGAIPPINGLTTSPMRRHQWTAWQQVEEISAFRSIIGRAVGSDGSRPFEPWERFTLLADGGQAISIEEAVSRFLRRAVHLVARSPHRTVAPSGDYFLLGGLPRGYPVVPMRRHGEVLLVHGEAVPAILTLLDLLPGREDLPPRNEEVIPLQRLAACGWAGLLTGALAWGAVDGQEAAGDGPWIVIQDRQAVDQFPDCGGEVNQIYDPFDIQTGPAEEPEREHADEANDH